jgi:hypothetical protein
MVAPMDNNDTRDLLTGFGYDEHTACLIASYARRHDLTHADIEAWIVEATTSQTIRNPLGFVRARIQGGDKPPSLSVSRSTHADRNRYLTQFACSTCGTYPCVCDWDPEIEALHDYRKRMLEQERSQS